MFKRHALLLGYAGKQNKFGYLKGVKKDLKNYLRFLTSAYGGAWRPEEVTTLLAPKLAELKAALKQAQDSDYSFVVYVGLGRYPKGGIHLDLHFNLAGKLSETDLQLPNIAQTIILDTCRVPGKNPGFLPFAPFLQPLLEGLVDVKKSRFAYDQAVIKSGKQHLFLYSCSPTQTARDTEKGGLYSTYLIQEAENWVTKQCILSAQETALLPLNAAHRLAGLRLLDESPLQSPYAESNNHHHPLPFAVFAPSGFLS